MCSVERRLIEERRRRARPRDFKRTRRLDGVPLFIGDDAEEALVPHDLGGGDILVRTLVDAHGNGAGDFRPDHAAVHHPRNFNVGDKVRLREHFGRDVVARNRLPDDRVILGIFRLRLARSIKRIAVFAVPVEMNVEELTADEFGVADLLRRIGRATDNAVGHRQLIGGEAELNCRHLNEDAPRLGRSHAHLPAALLDASRTGRAALIDAGRGIADENLDGPERNVEFLSHHLPDRDGESLAHIHFAEIGRRGAVGIDGKIGGKLIRGERRLGGDRRCVVSRLDRIERKRCAK